MNEQIRRQITREFPELAAGYHLPVMAQITEITDAPEGAGLNDNYRPRLAATVELLKSNYESTGITLTAVPCAIIGAGNERGFFALPEELAIVELAWLNGSPELPFIRSVLGYRKALPTLEKGEMKWQQNERNSQSIDKSGNWLRKTEGQITDKSHTHKTAAQQIIVTAISEAKRLLGHSTEDMDGEKKIEAAAINLLSVTVLNLLAAGSINMAAAEHITRAAAKDIKDNATENITAEAGKDYSVSAGSNAMLEAAKDLELIASKIKLGTSADNLLELVSDAMQACIDGFTATAELTVTCTAPGSPSSLPLNAAAYAPAIAKITASKSKVDAMTL